MDHLPAPTRTRGYGSGTGKPAGTGIPADPYLLHHLCCYRCSPLYFVYLCCKLSQYSDTRRFADSPAIFGFRVMAVILTRAAIVHTQVLHLSIIHIHVGRQVEYVVYCIRNEDELRYYNCFTLDTLILKTFSLYLASTEGD